ncbi:Uncharacterized protein TCM_022726 [Theobroma cacao]|uniref:Retrotransposon gag domain-containing protein n=1 Tax=Theobroma cacao TaxID=3641 RepID=A0A061ETI1_THECC|nr:Uncharacterized protein TCM_022726 [Theobroma cacao]
MSFRWSKAKVLLSSLPTSLITTWDNFARKFLAKFFLLAKTAKMRNDITSFTQFDVIATQRFASYFAMVDVARLIKTRRMDAMMERVVKESLWRPGHHKVVIHLVHLLSESNLVHHLVWASTEGCSV